MTYNPAQLEELLALPPAEAPLEQTTLSQYQIIRKHLVALELFLAAGGTYAQVVALFRQSGLHVLPNTLRSYISRARSDVGEKPRKKRSKKSQPKRSAASSQASTTRSESTPPVASASVAPPPSVPRPGATPGEVARSLAEKNPHQDSPIDQSSFKLRPMISLKDI